MLLRFSVNNFRSIKDTATFSMVADSSNQENEHSFSIRNVQLLKSAAIYGANASGKSNVLKAMNFMCSMVLNRKKITQSTDELPHDPFLLNTETEHASSWFEIVFFVDDVKYRYGFEADDTVIYAEWLHCVNSDSSTNRETRLFERDVEQNLHYVNPKFKEGLGVNVPSNHLLIWKCDQNDGEISKKILRWFNKFNLIDGLDGERYISFALKQMEKDEFKTDLLKLVKVADLGIEQIDIEEGEIPKDLIKQLPFPDEIKQQMLDDNNLKSVELQTSHRKFDSNDQVVGSVLFELNKNESKGTQKFFALSTPILDTLRHGRVLVIDELDASLHPKLTEYFIKLFNNKDFNKHNAQLIFVTHDAHLLSVRNLFEREQIWFAEKDQYGSTKLYSLLEFRAKNTGKDVRVTDDLGKRYLLGHFGAVPYLGEL
jgi:AAA15 family ATPase/GTPase